jgi:hypothetical protein
MAGPRSGLRSTGGCAGCTRAAVDPAGSTRREFLRGAATALVGLVAVSGMAPADLAGLSIEWTEGRRSRSGTVSYPLPSDDGVTIDRENEIILVR